MTVTCVRVGCSRPLPDVAVKNQDPHCSRKCAEAAHGVTMAADLIAGGNATGNLGFGGVAVARTRLQREAAARSLEAVARVGREDKARKARERKAAW